MFGMYRLSPLGCAYYTMVGLTIVMLWITTQIYGDWRVETAGVWATGQIVSVSHCRNRSNQVLSTVQFTIGFTDSHGLRRTSQTKCEDDTYQTDQSIAIRYLPSDPGYILTRADIGGGQGFPLIVVAILDAVFSAVCVAGAVLMVRAARRKRVTSTPSAAPAALGASVARQSYRPRQGRLPRRLRRHNH